MIFLQSLVKSLDILSSQPLMKINGNQKFTTKLTITLSLTCIITIIVLSLFIVLDVVSRNNFTMFYNLDNRQFSRIKVNQTQTALILFDPVGNEFAEHDRYFNFLVKFWNVTVPDKTNFENDSKNKNFFPTIKIIDLPLKNCSQMNYPKLNHVFINLSKAYKSAQCIDFSSFNNESLFGTYGGIHGYSTLNIYIRKCINSTINNKTNCFSESLIDTKLS